MNRPIKFRAWSENKMYYFGLTDVISEDYRLYFDTEQGLLKLARFNDNDFVLMQFTGLTDKNGKEIYEDDLILLNDTKYQVSWFENWGGFGLLDFPTPQYPQRDRRTMNEITNGEVIGNAYEGQTR